MSIRSLRSSEVRCGGEKKTPERFILLVKCADDAGDDPRRTSNMTIFKLPEQSQNKPILCLQNYS